MSIAPRLVKCTIRAQRCPGHSRLVQNVSLSPSSRSSAEAGTAATIAVRVTDWPNVAGFADDPVPAPRPAASTNQDPAQQAAAVPQTGGKADIQK